VQAWLIDPFLAPSARLNGAAKAWLPSLLASTAPSLLPGRAALGLAASGEISFGEVAALVDSVPSSVAPDIVAALGVIAPETDAPDVKAVIPDEVFGRLEWRMRSFDVSR